MNKKYIVRLSDEERGVCQEIVKRLKGTSEKVKRAQILLRADAAGPSGTIRSICAGIAKATGRAIDRPAEKRTPVGAESK